MDIPAIDTTTPMGQQAYMTGDQAYMLNSQVNSFLSSCPLYLDNGNTRTLVLLRNDGEEIGFDHDIICRANGAARSVCNLPHSSIEGVANGADHSVLDHSLSRNKGGADGVVHPVLDLSRNRNFIRAYLFTPEVD